VSIIGGATSVRAADVDGDGDLDIVGAAAFADDIAWWSNLNGLGTSWGLRTVDPEFDGAEWVEVADMDADGDLDLLGAAFWDDDITWWENTDTHGISWTGHTVDGGFSGAKSVYPSDLDGDGDLDIIGAANVGDEIAWWENTTIHRSAVYPFEHPVDSNFYAASDVTTADMDRDGHLDILGAASDGYDITWWENRGGQYALDIINTAPTSIPFGEMDDLLRIEMAHRGRIGDTDEEFAALGLLLEGSPGDPLTSAEANAIIDALHVYLDDGDRTFEPQADTLVTTVETLSLSAGYQQVLFGDGDPNVQVVHNSPRTYFAVVEPACYPAGSQFRITHGITGGSTAEDRDHDILLTLEYTADTSSGIVTIPGCSMLYLPLVTR
jgi:hypothetical protein